MIGFRYDGDVPVYLGNEIYPAVFVFVHRANGEAQQACVPRVREVRFEDHAAVSLQTLSPSLAGQPLHSGYAAPSLHVHEPSRLLVQVAHGYSRERVAYVLRVELAPASSVLQSPTARLPVPKDLNPRVPGW